MDIDEKKEFLNRYRDSMKLIESYRIQIEALEVAANGGAIRYSDLPKSKQFNKIFEDKIIAAADVVTLLEAEIEKQKEILVEVVSAINTLEDPEEHIVMSMRYVECMSWESIEAQRKRSEDVFRIHREALDHIVIDDCNIKKLTSQY